MSEPGSIIIRCPYCGTQLCADKVEFIETNVILPRKKIIPPYVITGPYKRHIHATCSVCDISLTIEMISKNQPEENK